MGIIAKAFGGGSQPDAQPLPMPVAPPVAPPAYTQPQAASGAGSAANISDGAKAMGAFGNTIITGPEGLKTPEKTSSPSLKSQLGN